MPDDPTDIAGRPQHPYVDRRRPHPADAAPRVLTLLGLLANSDRPGFRRMYFHGALDFCAEFRSADVIEVSDIAADQSPFAGETATLVTIREGAQIECVRAHTTDDLFDLQLRLRSFACAPSADCPPNPTIGPAMPAHTSGLQPTCHQC
jgi:hypothetical protein